jgi:hypothetical protein
MTVEEGATDAQPQDQATPAAPTKDAAPAAAETKTENQQDMPKWVKARLGEMTAQKYTMKQQMDAIAAENARLQSMIEKGQIPQKDMIPVDQVRNLVRNEANKIAATKLFDDQCNQIYDKGMNEFDDFRESLGHFGPLGGLPPQVIEAANEVGDAHQILYTLSKDLDEADRIFKLGPVKLAVELSKLHAKINKRTRTPSKAPDPIKPIEGRSSEGKSVETMTTAEWMTWREEQLQAKAKAGR